jgi:outer membrane lipoprotein-sorting protein
MLAPASADSRLTPLSPEQLLSAVSSAQVPGLSGTVAENASLGLPAFAAASGSLLGLASGSHSLRVWYAGKTKQRVAMVDKSGEYDVFHNGADVWEWDSAKQEATHSVLSDDAQPSPTGTTDPRQLAHQVLEAVGSETTLSTGPEQKVAGRTAYQLVLTPKQTGSRVSSVTVAIDGDTHIPLGVQVYGPDKSSGPVVNVAYLDIDFSVPDASMFTFTPPQSAKVTERTTSSAPSVKTVGTGWTQVVELPSSATGSAAGLAKFLPAVEGDWGSGHLLDSDLVCALVTSDGRVLAGAVDPSVLYAAAASH